MTDHIPITLPYNIAGIQFEPSFGSVSIQYARPEDEGRISSESRLLTFNPGATPEVAELIADVLDSLCQLIDLVKVEERAPAPQVQSWFR